MPLQKQILPVPIGAGVDELRGTMAPSSGKLAVAQNARIVDVGTVEQRPGSTAMSSSILGGGTIAAARRLMRCGDEILLDDGNGLHTYVSDDGRWRTVDNVSEVMIDKRIPGERGAAAYGCKHDATWCSGMYVHAWSGPVPGTLTYNCYVRITDELTGARLAVVNWHCENESGVRVVMLPGSTLVYVFYVHPAGDGTRQICCRWVDVEDPTVWAAEVIVVSITGATPWDACAMTGTRHAIIYDVAAGGRVSEVDSFGAIQDTANLGAHLTRAATISYDATANRVYLSYCAASPNGLREESFSRGPLVNVFDVQVDADIYTGGSAMLLSLGQSNVTAIGARLVYSLLGDTQRPAQTRNAVVANGGAVTAGDPTYHVVAWGVPRFIGTRWYCVGYMPLGTSVGEVAGSLTPEYTLQYGAWLMEVPTSGQARAVCRVGWSLAAYHETTVRGPTAVGLNLCSVGYVSAIGMRSDAPRTAIPGEDHEGFDLYTFDWAPSAVPLGVEQDGELVMSGGVPNVYCGDRLSEYGFHFYPTLVLRKGAAGAIPAGDYAYAVCYVHTDARGVVHRSAPAYEFVTLGVGDDEVLVDVSQYTLTTRMDSSDSNAPAQIEIYRTLIGGAAPYYHLITITVDKSLHTCTYDDINTINDGVLATRRTLYTGGGVLENKAPPASRHVVSHNNRVWVISADEPDRMWISKIQSLREAQGFHEVLTYRIAGADLVALASIENKLVAFGKRGIWYITGSGPTDSNQNNDLAEPTPISTEHGCADARSVCVFPGGATFQSTDGLLYIVTPAMQVQPISLAVYDTLHSYPVIESVSYVSDDHELRVVASTSGGDSSVVLVWNVLMDQWYVWNTKSSAGASNPKAVGGAVVSWSGQPDRFALLLSSGVVLRESGYTDPDATYPTVTIRTAPLGLSGVQSYQRMWGVDLLFEKLVAGSHSDVNLSVYNNHETASATWTAQWLAATCASAQTVPRLQLNAHAPLSNQKCESVALGVSWVPVGGKNLRLQSLALQLGVKAGWPRILPAAARK